MNRLIIIGASGHGKVVADIAQKCGYEEIVFLDDNENIVSCYGFAVLGKVEKLPSLEGDVFVAIGDGIIRKRVMDSNAERVFPVLIHPFSSIAKDTIIGQGSVVMAGTVINPGSRIGKGCIINTSSSIDHDCVVSNYVHVSVGAHLSGTVIVGENTWIGAGTTISNNIRICNDCMIGAGAVVVRDLLISGTYIGIPAKKRE